MTHASRLGFEWFARAVFRCYCPLRVTGRQHLPPMPFIVCSNHASHMDSIALMIATGYPFHCFAMLAANDYFFRNPVVHRAFSSLVQLIPIDRRRGAASLHEAIGRCREFLGHPDRSLILFPEGTRSPDGEMGRFKRGISLMAAELDLPIVPAYIEGSAARMPKGRVFPTPGRVSVHIGAPIVHAGHRRHDEVVIALEQSIRALKTGALGTEPEMQHA